MCAWIEANCVYGEGDWYGQPVRLRDWQRRFIYRLYEFDPDTGLRRYKRALLGVGKGNGKTPLAAWIGAYELFGGEILSPRVIVGAASLKQANLVFADLGDAVTGPEWAPSPLKPYVDGPYNMQILVKGRPGVAERIAAEAGTNDGARCSAFLADELHEWIEPKVRRVFMIVEGATGKRRNAFTLGITTSGVKGDSILSEMYEHGRRVALGMATDDAFLFEWYEAPEKLNLDDPAEWEEAVRAANPAYGDFLDPDYIRSRWDGARKMPRFEFERYHLNRWTAALQRWLPIKDWDACSGEPAIPGQAPVWVGIDYGKKRDTTGVAVVHKDEEGLLHAKVKVFAPTDGQWVDREQVRAHLWELTRTYDVQQILYDRYLFEETAETLYEAGLPMVEVPQTVPRKAQYSQALYDAVIERKLRHGGDRVLRAHADAVVAQDRGNVWTIEKAKSSAPIDAIVALAMAIQAAVEDAGGDYVFQYADEEEES